MLFLSKTSMITTNKLTTASKGAACQDSPFTSKVVLSRGDFNLSVPPDVRRWAQVKHDENIP